MTGDENKTDYLFISRVYIYQLGRGWHVVNAINAVDAKVAMRCVMIALFLPQHEHQDCYNSSEMTCII